MFTRTYIYIYIYIYIYTYMPVDIYMYTHVYIYIYVYTHPRRLEEILVWLTLLRTGYEDDEFLSAGAVFNVPTGRDSAY